MIGQKPESTSLREYGRVVIDRTISKAKNQTARHPITLCDLGHFTVCKALAIKGAQCVKELDCKRYRKADPIATWIKREGVPDPQLSWVAGPAIVLNEAFSGG